MTDLARPAEIGAARARLDERELGPALLGRAAASANTARFGPIAVAIPLGSAAVQLGGRPALLAAAAIWLTAAAVAAPYATRPSEAVTYSGIGDVKP